MATVSTRGQRAEAVVRAADNLRTLRLLWAHLVRAWQLRRDNYWLATVAVPLAMIATALLGLWWTWVLLVGVAAAFAPGWRSTWLLALELGGIGTAWASAGASGLATWPTERIVVGAIWAGVALAFAIDGYFNRRRRASR
jgi:hypothetical protein